MGGSAGGLRALTSVLNALPINFTLPIVVVLHQRRDSRSRLVDVLARACTLKVKEAEDKEPLLAGSVHVAPPNYHLLIERDGSLSLSADALVSYARPSIDVLFETAAETFGPNLVGVLLTGANTDGCAGMKRIKELGGTTIAQDPASAEAPLMPRSAIDAGVVDHVVAVEEIGPMLMSVIAPG